MRSTLDPAGPGLPAEEKRRLLARILQQKAARATPFPLSFAQQRLWLVDRLEPGSAAYNMPYARRLRGVPDVGALRASVDGLARRHETLRTTFAEQGGVPVQVVHPPAPVELPMVDLGGLPAAAREPEALRLAGEEALRPFDLSRGPLMRSTLLRLDAEDHVLLFTLHHIVSDGWSMDVLARDVTALYAAHAHGGEPALPVLPVQYADYALWQRAWLRGEELDRQLAWWRERLAGAPALLELPTDRPRPAVQRHRGAVRSLRIDAAAAGELRALCRREGATVFMTLLAGFAVLLGRYSGQADVVVGVPAAARGRRDTEGLIGYFLNTLALRTDLSGDPTFRELLGRAREATVGAYDHQDLPFERILEELQPARTLSHSPLFQVMLNLQNFGDKARLDFAGVRAEPFGRDVPAAKYDLTLYAGERDGGIRLDLVYDADLFEDARMEDALGHLRTLLAAVAADPELRVSRIPLLTGEERRARSVRARGIGTDRPFQEFARGAVEGTIPGRFEAQVRLHPDRPAVRTRTARLTYAELDRAAGAVARAILRARPAAGERVALLFEHDAAMIVGMLGALKAGKTYVPIDPLYPRERSAYVLEDSGAAALLTNRANLALARELAGERVPVVDLDAVDMAGDAPVSFPEVLPDEPAYILYTSGSTGRPKGVVQSHRNVLHFIRVYTDNLRIGPGDRLTLFSSYTFDASVMAVYGALLNGAALLPLGWREETASGVAEWMRREGITLYHSTPTVFRHLVEELGAEERFPEVRLVVLGGEEAQSRDVEAFRAHFAPGAVLVNGLGPTESTVTLQHFIGHDTPLPRSTVPVGRPVEDTEVVLRNGLGEQVAVYGVGEIEIHGEHVALGYWRRPEQTAAAFGPAPRAGARSYRTGDLGRRLPDGSLEFVGRADFQVKVRGVRVEPGEIEAAMRAHPGVREAVVAAREDGGAGGRRLAGYVVAAEGAEVPAPEELRAWLRERLPDYMVPAVFVRLEALPLTPGGKVDRLALPAPERPEDAGARAPRTPVEEVLAQIWAEVLGLDRAGVGEDFFELGGHSLLATRLISRVREALGVELPLRAVFEAPTVAALAERVEAAGREGAPRPPPLVPVPRDGSPLPLSFAQQRLWFLDQLDPGSAAYNLAYPLRVRGGLRVRALERALRRLVHRHESLRTRFPVEDGEPVQRVEPAGPVRLPVVELGALGEAAREAGMRRLVGAEARRPFDLSRGPLMRSTLLRLDAEDHVLLLTLHHAVGDGWSTGVLLRELSALYGASSRGAEARLPELPVQYADYAAWQRRWLAGETLEGQLAYWRERLAGAPALLELPTDRPRPAVQGGAGATRAFRVPAPTLGALRLLARREGATLFMTLLAAWQLLLGRYGEADDVVVGTPIAGRNRLETEGLIGFFVNTLVLRADLSGDPGFRELLRRTREATLGAYQHQDLPFEKLVEELGVERSLAHTPLFQAMFVFQSDEGAGLELGEAAMEEIEGGAPLAKFDLTLGLAETERGLEGALSYRRELWDAATAERMLDHLRHLLEGVAAEPGRRLSEVSLLAGAERARVLEEWNATGAAFPRERCLHELFAEQAARTPHAPALRFRGRATSYAELERAANRLAHALRRRGVRPETRVGLLFPRGPELLVALLGTLKAGGAFVPLDPAHPAERLRALLADAGAPLLLTQSRLRGRLAPAGVEVLCPDADRAEIEGESAAAPESGAVAENLAYVVYTSGSTGLPKGVCVSHRGAVNHLQWIHDAVLGPEVELLPATTRASFDASLKQLLGPLLRGRPVWILDEDTVASPGAILRELEDRPALAFNCVPSLWSAMLDAVEGGCRAPSGLVRVLLGGEAFGAELVERTRALLPGVEVWNLYGPTETTVNASAGRVLPGAPPTMGRGAANARLYVLDGWGSAVPAGVAGELYVGGAGVARGYLGRVEQTAEAFVPDPFGREVGARLYRTGDRVRWLASGELEYLGRTDFQVKVRGFRIEPGEIETALRAHPAVREAVVAAREDSPGQARLVAYLAPAAAGGLPVAELREHLSVRLPSYMVPGAFVELESIPLTPNGKVDRSALPAPERLRPDEEYVAPRDVLELTIAGAWEEVLGISPVGVRDDFFELGGHSLLAVRLVGRIQKLTGQGLPLAALFTAPTVEGLASALRGGAAGAAARPLVPIQPAGGERPLFFVHAVGGNVIGYAALSRHLGSGQPFYGLQSRGLEGDEAPHPGVEAMAADYLAEIRAVQPEGPYRLGGWSMGGLVAFEMARQAEAAGEPVELLALVDPSLPGGPDSRPLSEADDPDLLASFARHLGIPAERISTAPAETPAPSPAERLRFAWEAARAEDVVPPDLDLTRFGRLWSVFRHNVEALRRYRPGRGSAGFDVLLVCAEERSAPPETAPAAWRALTSGRVELALSPGDHFGMVREPHVRELAALLAAALASSRHEAAAPEVPPRRE